MYGQSVFATGFRQKADSNKKQLSQWNSFNN